MSDHSPAQYKALRAAMGKRYRHDYYGFLTNVLGMDFPQIKAPAVKQFLQEYGSYLNDYLATKHLRDTPYKILVCVPRGCVKSAGITQPGPSFLHLFDEDIAMGICSERYEDMATAFTEAAGQIMKAETKENILPDIYGNFFSPKRKWSASELVTAHRKRMDRSSSTLTAYSVTKGAVSKHMKGYWLDDPVTNEMLTRDSDWLHKMWMNYIQTAAVIDPDGILTVVGTRYHAADCIGRIISDEIEPAVKKKLGKLPADWDREKGWIPYADLAGWKVIYREVYTDKFNMCEDTIWCPEIWSHSRIQEERAKGVMGEAFFWAQLMNQPQHREDNPITKQHIDRCMIQLDQVPPQAYNCITIQMDLAIKDGENYIRQSGDATVIQVWGQFDGEVYLLDGFYGRPTQEIFDDQLIMLFKRWRRKGRIRLISYDRPLGQGNGAKYTQTYIKSVFNKEGLSYPRILELQRNKKKAGELMAVTHYWIDGCVHLVQGVPGIPELCYEMMNIGYTKHDDAADAAKDIFHKDIYKVPARKMGGEETRRWTPRPAIRKR